ncbi:hypothetical protein A8F70_25875 [Burkholderia cenocepacia]|nr:hypothetical protein A8F65_05500 [Burkholderia cenocepacia]OOB29597.1 hypothetical protein A8F70_25875 [Burkholderia cenocepacia]
MPEVNSSPRKLTAPQGLYETVSKAKKHAAIDGVAEPEFYVLTPEFIRTHHRKSGGWEKVMLRGLDIDAYKGSKGFDLIAQALDIPYPAK